MKLSGREKATIFLSILGAETSTAILRYLPEELADIIAQSVNQLPTPTPEALGQVFSDFKSYSALPPSVKSDIFEEEEKQEEGRGISQDNKKLARLLSAERRETAAFLLHDLPPMQREEILMNMTSNREQIDDLIANIKPTYLKDKLKEKLFGYFEEKS